MHGQHLPLPAGPLCWHPMERQIVTYTDMHVLQEAVLAADVTCGLSLGEYTALTFAGAIRCAMPGACSA